MALNFVGVFFMMACILGSINGVFARKQITWDDLVVTQHDFASNKVIVVDQTGNGDSTTIQGAIDMVPQDNTNRIKIYIYPGVYRERVHVPKNKPYISLIGKPKNITVDENSINVITKLGELLPIITNSTKASDIDSYGNQVGTVNTATVFAESDFFCATALTIQNLVDKNATGRQAVALRVDSDRALFYRVRFVGEQDTLLDSSGTHYYFQSYIEGDVDFIFGNGKSLFRECVIHSVAESSGSITAHARESLKEDTGYVFDRCNITGSGNVILGRPWRPYGTVIYSYCHMDAIIDPFGWNDWNKPSYQKTVIFREFRNQGEGSNTTQRVKWSKTLSRREAKHFFVRDYINKHRWLRL